MISVAIVDDHKVLAAGLAKLIDETSEARVFGMAHSAAGCWNLLNTGQPDVMLLDISMPDGMGIDLCPKIKMKYPSIKVLMLTSYNELITINSALNAGADGYILKNSMPEEIIQGIRTVASGKLFLCEEVDLMLKAQEESPLEFTRRECNLLSLLAKGYTNAEIAEHLHLGYETIRSYRKNLYTKLSAHNTRQLIQKATEMKLI
jgi:DNA-binding NarL/FixJ family response regulator